MARAKHLIAAFALVLLACRREPTPQPSPRPEPQSPPVIPTPKTPAVEAIVHDDHELHQLDLSEITALDLALSPSDRIGHFDGQPSDPCQGLHLEQVADRAPALRALRLSGCHQPAETNLSAFGPRLQVLELADMPINAAIVDQLTHLTGLLELRLSRASLVDGTTLRPLANLQLEHIVLDELDRDSDLSLMLDQWPQTLRHVVLRGRWAGHKSMLTLSRSEHLESLALIDTRIGNFSLNQVKSLHQLNAIKLVGKTFSDYSPLYIRDLPVTSFYCDCPHLGDAGLRALHRSKGITALHLPSSRITGAGLDELEGLPLASVSIAGLDLSGAGFEALARHPTLTELRLSGHLSHPVPEGLGALTHLKTLVLHYDNLDDRASSQLEPLVGLVELDLSHTQISDRGLASLRDMHELKTLRLHHTRVTNRGLAYLAELEQLEVLELDHTDVVDEGVAYLATLPHLRELRLDHTLVTDQAMDALSRLKRLERLNLSHTVVTEAGLRQLQALQNLELLSVDHTRVSR